MKPKSIITVTPQSLPMILKYQDREYVIRLTSNNNLQMTKNNNKIFNNEGIEIDPNPFQVDLSKSAMVKFKIENEL